MDQGIMNLVNRAEQGDIDAMVMLGDCYTKGIHTTPDDVKSHMYYQMAADKGHAQASLMVAIDYFNGLGVKENEKKAIKYLQYAADSGVPYAQFLLGTTYKAGRISKFSGMRNAIKYFDMAANKGEVHAQIALADMILEKCSVASKYTLEDAIFWLVCAVLHQSEEYKEQSKEAEKRIYFLVNAGLPGGKERVLEVLRHVQANYPNLIK